ncbi:MAG TPA: TonB family protein [Polyangiales bacterium]|nr:TonB family protein [Polyangiales bacterium]
MRDVGGPQRGEEPGTRGNQRPSGLRAVLDTLRSIPERMRRPESLLLVMAIMASIGMHMPPYLGLGALADYFEEQEKQHKKEELPPVDIDVVTQPQPEQVKPPEPPAPAAKAPKPKPKPKKKEEEKKQKQELAKKEQEKPQPTEPQKPENQPPPPADRKQSITQKSADPNVEPPPDARFLAEESQRVQEESIASITSETRDDPKPKAAAPMSAEAERAGDSRQDEKGAQKGAEQEQPQQVASRQRQPQTERPEGQPTPDPSQTPRTPAPAPKAEAPQEQVIRDPLGTFVLAPSAPQQHDHDHGGGPSGAGGKSPNLKVSWRAFEETFGAEQLAMDRLPREAKRRGAGREKRWEEFRAAIENYVEGVKPGNTTALNAAADPFAAYLAAFHRNLHAEFAYDFVASLPMAGELGNPMLVTKVEIVVNPDGSLDRVGVVKSSGNLMYDFGAFNAVHRGSPYPATPEKIRSPDGRVYMRWALHRDQNMCGTWLAEPYILKTAPRSPNDPPQDNISPFLPGRGPAGGGGEHGSNEPKGGGKGSTPGKTPAVAPGETLGQRSFRVHPVRRG